MNSNNLRCMNGQNKVLKSSDYVNQETNSVTKLSHGMNQADSEIKCYTLQHNDLNNSIYEILT